MVEVAELAVLSSAPVEVVEVDELLELESPVLSEVEVLVGVVVIDVPKDDDAT